MSDVRIRHRQGAFTLDVEFSLASPWTVIFGPSGAGKSTVLRILAGLIEPDWATIAIAGQSILDADRGVAVAPGRRSIGFVTQQAALFPHLTARDNVAFGIRGLSRPEREQRVAAMLQLFGAEDLAARRPAQLSGGERQRVALARALASHPKLLLLDEPIAALDDASGQDILARLLALDVRVVYVSHDLAEIWRLPAEVIVLEAGRVTATGPLRAVLATQRDRLLQSLAP
ncbi:MAG TPA: ATP-binding cassette domain-containing protein [Acidobacteriaceae bacterium]|jgi:ABC-type molybdate transport system ATPase subunit|nr:ATP-binding cassette domain-containing protein [Acidobacteriaceae bacterium]